MAMHWTTRHIEVPIRGSPCHTCVREREATAETHRRKDILIMRSIRPNTFNQTPLMSRLPRVHAN